MYDDRSGASAKASIGPDLDVRVDHILAAIVPDIGEVEIFGP